MGTLAGKTFSITGTLSKGRKQYVELIERLGGTFKKNVSNKTTFVIAGDDAYLRDTGKLEKAKELDLFIITEQEFMNMCGMA